MAFLTYLVPAFSREKSKQRAIEIKIRRAKQMAKSNPSYKLKHVAEARDADKGQYTLLVKRITEETKEKQLRNEKFRSKLHGL